MGHLSRHTFETIIDSNVNLTKIQKFYYLQSAVKGRASQYFQSLSLSNENYDAAWKLLKSRFESKRLIVHYTHVHRFGNCQVKRDYARQND